MMRDSTEHRVSPAFRTFLLATAAMILIAGCNENPATIGNEYLPEDVEFTEYTLVPEDYSIESGIAAISNSGIDGGAALVVGRAADGTVAHGLMAVSTASDLLSGITGPEIQSAELLLRTFGYRYGAIDSRRIEFDVVGFEGIFGSSAQWSDTLVPRIEAGDVLGSYNGDYPDSAVISIPLAQDATADFLTKYFIYDTTITTTGTQPDTIIAIVTQKSLSLRATKNGEMIGSFLGASFLGLPDSLQPTLRITLADTTIDLDLGVSNWITQLPVSFETGKDILAAVGGVPVRTSLKFSLDSIPTNAVIHQARLILHSIEEDESSGSTGIVKSVVAYIAQSDPLSEESFLVAGNAGIRGFREALDSISYTNKYTFTSLGTTLSSWLRVRRGDAGLENNGLILALQRSSPDLETGTVDRITFHGTDAPEDLRPQLTIIYSTQAISQ